MQDTYCFKEFGPLAYSRYGDTVRVYFFGLVLYSRVGAHCTLFGLRIY